MTTASNFIRARDALRFTTHPTPGKAFFVCSVNGVSGGGSSPDQPALTIAAALLLCTADKGDTIFVLPGHVETITGAGGVTVSTAGVTIVGIGHGRQRGLVNYTTAAAASFDITAARTTIENLVFTMTGVDAVTAGINISAADCVIRNCEIETADATNQAALGILTTAAANRLRIENCHIHGTGDAGTTTQISMVGGTDIVIRDNVIIGACGASAGNIANATTDSKNLVIHGNLINNLTASSTKVIVLTATSTGLITNNRLAILSGTAPVTGAAMNFAGNVYSAAAGVTAGTASTF